MPKRAQVSSSRLRSAAARARRARRWPIGRSKSAGAACAGRRSAARQDALLLARATEPAGNAVAAPGAGADRAVRPVCARASADVAAPVATQVPVVTADPGSAKPTPVATRPWQPHLARAPHACRGAPLGRARTFSDSATIAAAADSAVARESRRSRQRRRQPVRVDAGPAGAALHATASGRARIAVDQASAFARAYVGARSPQHEIAGSLAIRPSSRTPNAPAPAPVALHEDLQFVAVDELDRIESSGPCLPAQALRDRTRRLGRTRIHDHRVGHACVTSPCGRRAAAACSSAPPRTRVAAWRFRPRYVNGQPVLHRSSSRCVLPSTIDVHTAEAECHERPERRDAGADPGNAAQAQAERRLQQCVQ